MSTLYDGWHSLTSKGVAESAEEKKEMKRSPIKVKSRNHISVVYDSNQQVHTIPVSSDSKMKSKENKLNINISVIEEREQPLQWESRLTIDIKGVNVGMLNALRLIMEKDVPIMAFDSAEELGSLTSKSIEEVISNLGLIALDSRAAKHFLHPSKCSCTGYCPRCAVLMSLHVKFNDADVDKTSSPVTQRDLVPLGPEAASPSYVSPFVSLPSFPQSVKQVISLSSTPSSNPFIQTSKPTVEEITKGWFPCDAIIDGIDVMKTHVKLPPPPSMIRVLDKRDPDGFTDMLTSGYTETVVPLDRSIYPVPITYIGRGQYLNLKCIVRQGSGRDGSIWRAVTRIAIRDMLRITVDRDIESGLTIEQKLCLVARCPMNVFEYSKKNGTIHATGHGQCTRCDECVRISDNPRVLNAPGLVVIAPILDHHEMTIGTNGQIEPIEALVQAIDIFISKCQSFYDDIMKQVTEPEASRDDDSKHS